MSNEYLEKLAKELKETRKKKKLSIDHIFTKTRIDRKYLSAIEDGDFSIMPEVYIRAFIKEYSKTIGLDSDDVLSKFDKAKAGHDYAEPSEEVGKVETQVIKEKIKTKISQATKFDEKPAIQENDKKTNTTFYYALVAVLMLLFIFIIYKAFLTEKSTEIVTEKTFDKIVQSQNHSPTEINNEPTPENQNKIEVSKIEPKKNEQIERPDNIGKKLTNDKILPKQQIKAGELTLTIIGSEKSWIRIVSDEKDNVEFIIDKGVTKVLNAKDKFYLHIGNSGGIKLLLNNQDLSFSGATGRVRKIFVTKNGIEYLRRTPIINAD